MDTMKLKLEIELNQPMTVFALQIGGYLPLAFTPTPILLVDRNIVSLIDEIKNKSSRQDIVANTWWFNFINSSAFSLNPLIYAIEGNKQKIPSFVEFCEQFNLACIKLQQGFPNARIANYSKELYDLSYQIILDVIDCYQIEKESLLQAIPLIRNHCSDKQLYKIENQLFDIVKNTGIIKSPLVLLAVLSCLYEDNGDKKQSWQLGRKILKPSCKYGEKDVHNALSDLRALEILIVSNNPQVAFCTRDKYLAAFWCAIQAENIYEKQGNTTRFDITLNQKLFPRLTQEGIQSLMVRIKSLVS